MLASCNKDDHRVGQAHHKAGEQHVDASFFKVVADLAGAQAADHTADDSDGQENSGQLINVIPLGDNAPNGKSDSCNEHHKDQLLPPIQPLHVVHVQRNILCGNPVNLVSRAEMGISLHSPRVPHDIRDAHGQQHHEHSHPQAHSREHGKTCDALCHAGGERVCNRTRIAGRSGAEDNSHRRQRVKTHGQAAGQNQRHKCQKFLKVGAEGGAAAKNNHTHRNHQQLFSPHRPHHIGHSGVDRAGAV